MITHNLSYNEMMAISKLAFNQELTMTEYTSKQFKAVFFPPSDKKYYQSFGHLYFKDKKDYTIFILKKDGVLK